MDKNMLKDFNFTVDEESLITYAKTGNTGEINQSRIIATLILTKQLEQSTEQLNCDFRELFAELFIEHGVKMSRKAFGEE